MGVWIVILVLALSCWILVTTWRRLRQKQLGRAWWLTFASLIVLGLAVGSWAAFNMEYQVSPRMRFASFPIPLAFFHLEDGNWIDFVTPDYVMYPGLGTNVVACVAIAVLPVLFVSLLHRRRN